MWRVKNTRMPPDRAASSTAATRSMTASPSGSCWTMPTCMSYTIRARRSRTQRSSNVSGMSSPKPRCIRRLWLSRCSIVRLGNVDRRVHQRLERERGLKRNVLPLQIAGLREGKVGNVAFRFVYAVQLEDDHDARLIGPRVILAHDARLPQSPDIRDFLAQERRDGVQGDAWFEPVESNNAHGNAVLQLGVFC